ncbi:MAG TPA: Uma2 family endonuclease [Chitinophagaceae bacterium]|nr:Uma2 family endonuclease [Chitinophagaceae bacterium]
MDIEEPAVKYQLQMWPADYLDQERNADTKHEYADGKIIAMAWASPAHNKILANLIGHTYPRLSGKPCKIYPSDLRIYVKSKESYFYPDASIVCGDLEFSDDKQDTVKNPSVIFEILSPSTQDYDIGRKFFFYMQIPTLGQYITIDSASLHVRSGIRQPDNTWKFIELEKITDTVPIEPVGFELALKDIYEDIALPDITENEAKNL